MIHEYIIYLLIKFDLMMAPDEKSEDRLYKSFMAQWLQFISREI